MTETKQENQDNNLGSDSFDDEDDLWALQSAEKDLPSQTIDDLDEEQELFAFEQSPQVENSEATNPVNEEIVSSPSEINTEAEINDSHPAQEIELNQVEVSPQTQLNTDTISPQELESDLPVAQVQEVSEPSEVNQLNHNLNALVVNALSELEQKKQDLEDSIAKLENRREKIRQEMRTSFAGVSQDLAIRVQGFKDYLVGSLQDLTTAAEQLDLISSNDNWEEEAPANNTNMGQVNNSSQPRFAEAGFQDERKQIRQLLDQYRTHPDYYGPPWQLRRTFEPIHAQKVADWFFEQSGKGAISAMGSRLQNILVSSAIISILSHLYGDRSRILILADSPEKLGEWRRGLQDCLGISRADFGPNRGVILFETAQALIKKGDRIVEHGDLPLIIMDLNDDRVSLSLLKFPLWLAFAPESPVDSQDYYY